MKCQNWLYTTIVLKFNSYSCWISKDQFVVPEWCTWARSLTIAYTRRYLPCPLHSWLIELNADFFKLEISFSQRKLSIYWEAMHSYWYMRLASYIQLVCIRYEQSRKLRGEKKLRVIEGAGYTNIVLYMYRQSCRNTPVTGKRAELYGTV